VHGAVLIYLAGGPTVHRSLDFIRGNSLPNFAYSTTDFMYTIKISLCLNIIPVPLLELLFDDRMYFSDLYRCYVIPENGYSECNTFCALFQIISTISY